MSGQLYLSVRALTKVGLSGLDELKVTLAYGGKELLQLNLVCCQTTLIICLFDKGCRCLDSLDITHQYGITSFWHLTWALELMNFEPVLLKATLGAVLRWLPLALGAVVEWHELLFKRTSISSHVATSVEVSIALMLQDFLQRAHFILALANVNDLIVGWIWDMAFAVALWSFVVRWSVIWVKRLAASLSVVLFPSSVILHWLIS